MQFDIRHGDSRQVLQTLPDNSVDSIVTDPPYELGFMGKGWDSTGIANDPALWAQALRVLKPGGHLLAFSGSRTYHRMVCAIEDAGFEIRDQIMWVYGSGFPKSHNGAHGGTALKPAHEPIVMARKPFPDTVAANFALHGVGGLNIDGARVQSHDGASTARKPSMVYDTVAGFGKGIAMGGNGSDLGRWPANLIHDGSDEVLDAFPQAPGQLADASSSSDTRKMQNTYGAMRRGRGDEASADSANNGEVGFKMRPGARRLDSGSAARFFYCAKASKADRGEGNTHPTVKPTELMRYLCRLVTPPGGLVLDPFMGSGSTGKAAVLEGFRFIGIEMHEEYAAIAQARIGHAAFGDLA